MYEFLLLFDNKYLLYESLLLFDNSDLLYESLLLFDNTDLSHVASYRTIFLIRVFLSLLFDKLSFVTLLLSGSSSIYPFLTFYIEFYRKVGLNSDTVVSFNKSKSLSSLAS